jgi:hypothetical protein
VVPKGLVERLENGTLVPPGDARADRDLAWRVLLWRFLQLYRHAPEVPRGTVPFMLEEHPGRLVSAVDGVVEDDARLQHSEADVLASPGFSQTYQSSSEAPAGVTRVHVTLGVDERTPSVLDSRVAGQFPIGRDYDPCVRPEVDVLPVGEQLLVEVVRFAIVRQVARQDEFGNGPKILGRRRSSLEPL